MGADTAVRVYVPVSRVLAVSTSQGQLIRTYRPPQPAGTSSTSPSTPQAAACHRGESLSRNTAFTASSSAAAPETV